MDTGAWYALEAGDDENHEQAVVFRDEVKDGHRGSLTTSDYVLDETVTLLRMKKGVAPALGFLDKVLASKSIHMVWVDPAIFHEGAKLMKESGTKKWSFTDCTSFAVMKQLGVKEAFAFDRNFGEAGFNRLP